MTLPGLDSLAEQTRSAIVAQDPTAYLLADHAWMRSVIDDYRPRLHSGADLAGVREDVLDLQARLDLHIRKEEEAFFPQLEDIMVESGQGSTFDMYGEHDAIRIRMEQLLDALDKKSDLGGAFSAFARSLLVHFENEEELIFAEAPAGLTQEQCRRIITDFLAMT